MQTAIEFLEPTINNIFAWFKNNGLVANSGKRHFLVIPYEKISLKILGSTIDSSPPEELLGITIDKHKISESNQKPIALARIATYLTIDKRKIFLNSFIIAQFNYCPLIWMCLSRTLNNKINRIHKQALRIVYNDYKSNFKELLE